MKTRKILQVLLIGIFALSIVNCSEEENDTQDQVTQQQQVEDQAVSSSWYISSFIDSGNDETNHFSGYTFEFMENGEVIATNNTVTYNGTWSITDSNSNDDSPDDLHFNIFFNLTNDFEDLNDDWDIISYSSSSIVLRDVSGGNGGVDDLTFTKS